jgi:xylulokinase
VKYLIGVDAGTTSFKAAVFNENGRMIASHGISYRLLMPEAGIVEYQAEGYAKVLHDVLHAIFEKSGISPQDVLGISIDSQGETLICLDKQGQPLRNAIVWLDNRAVREAGVISEAFGVQKVYETTGQPEIAATWPACKILWLKNHQPDIFHRTEKFLLLEDYLIYLLTGKYAAERSLLTSTIYLDIRTGTWWTEMLDFIGIRESCLPSVHDSGVPVGKVTSKAAEIFGLSEGTTVVTGALDQLAGMIGAGVTTDHRICETTGTCMAVCAPVNRVPAFRETFNVPCHAGALKGEYYRIYWSQTAGAVLGWFKDCFYRDMKDREDIYTLMNQEAAQAPPGSEGLVLLPHFSGTACPEFNADAKGVFYGIRLFHERKHFTRAIMESVSYMLKEHLTAAGEDGIVPDEIRSLGGGSRSRLWNQMKADITQKKIVTLKNTESTCLGAAILAGVGTGLFTGIASAAEKLAVCDQEFFPDDKNAQQYKKGYEAYLEIYRKLRDTFSLY